MDSKISDNDRELIAKLRKRVKNELTPYYDTDFNLLRWLQGHDYNFDIVVPKLRNHLRFRRSRWNLDEIAKKPRNHPIHAHWKNGITGPAKRTPNTIVNIEQSGSNDYWGMLQTYSPNEILRARLHDLEAMQRTVMEMEKKTGEQASILYFMDLNNLKYDKRLLTLMTGALASISSFMSEHYVELIHTFVLVHAPSFISTLWTVAKPLIPERTRNKVKIFGASWSQEVLKIACPESLPTFWNEPGSDIFKASVECATPFDPAQFYTNPLPDNMKLLSVGPGKTGFITAEAKKGQLLRWILAADGNFGCSAYYSANENESDIEKMKSIYPIFSKVPGPTRVPFQDEIICDETGFYKFWVSNEHAWFHTLRIRYSIEITSFS